MGLTPDSDRLAIAQSRESVPIMAPKDKAPFVRRFALHPALRDFGLTGSASFLTAVAAMLVIAVLGRSLGAAVLGEYLLIRRMASWLQAGVQLPSGVALPRYVAFSVDEPHSIKQAYFLSALLTGCGIALALGVILIAWKSPLSHLFFGSAQLDQLVLPLSLLLFGLAAHGATFGYYQGTLAMGRACALQIINLAAVPISVALLLKQTHSIPLIVNTMGISMIGITIFFALPIVRKTEFHISVQQYWKQTLELLSYGFARLSGDFSLQAMLSLPAVIAAHYLPMTSVTFLLFGGSFLAAVAAANQPLATILLARVSKSIAQKRVSQLQVHLSYLVSALIESSFFACLQLIVFTDVIVTAWVGPSFLGGIRVIRIVIIAVPFYCIHTGLRAAIDAAAVKAYNTRNALISLGTFLVLAGLTKICLPHQYMLEGLAASSVIGLFVLAVCGFETLRRLTQINLKGVRILQSLAVALILGAASYLLHNELHYKPGLLGLSVYELALSGLYFVLLRVLGCHWVDFIFETIFLKVSPRNASSGIREGA
jgi:O-antigen/teichoic acid export membrane protein